MAVSPSIALTPQAQIIVENNTLEDTSDDYGDVDFGNGFAARGRLGVALNTTLGQTGAAAATDLMLRASVWQLEAWEAAVLPLNYVRDRAEISGAAPMESVASRSGCGLLRRRRPTALDQAGSSPRGIPTRLPLPAIRWNLSWRMATKSRSPNLRWSLHHHTMGWSPLAWNVWRWQGMNSS